MTTEAPPLDAQLDALNDVEITIAGAPEGAWMAYLAGIDLAEWKDDDTGEIVPRYVWHWMADVEGKSTAIEQRTSRSTGPKSMPYQILVALVGSAAVRPAVTFRAGDLVGREAILTVEVAEGRSRVAAVTAVPKGRKSE